MPRSDSDEMYQACNGQRYIERWKNPVCSADIKLLERNISAILELDAQKTGDQVAAQEEEDGHAQSSGNDVVVIGMRDEHDQEGACAYAIETRDVGRPFQ